MLKKDFMDLFYVDTWSSLLNYREVEVRPRRRNRQLIPTRLATASEVGRMIISVAKREQCPLYSIGTARVRVPVRALLADPAWNGVFTTFATLAYSKAEERFEIAAAADPAVIQLEKKQEVAP